MRIAFTNSSNRLVGGAERYIETIAGFLQQGGHQTALWHETEIPHNRLPFPHGIFEEQYCVEKLGLSKWAASLKQWRPDVIFGHGLYDPDFEAETLNIAPGVLFVHNYDRTCISGTKCHMAPRIRACSRQFGPGCLLSFYPKRCGGLNPLTLIRDYRRTASRLEVVRMYRRVITHTNHVRDEYLKNGIACQATAGFCCLKEAPAAKRSSRVSERKRLLYIGRMAELKGGTVLLNALPKASRSLSAPIDLQLVGDGPSRKQWEREAAEIERLSPSVRIEFTGWLTGERYEEVTSGVDLYVLPSLWPEPFGMSGLELGSKGIPSVAFRVGGIPDWLNDGVNGVLADYVHPFPESLANAIAAALGSKDTYARLCEGARKAAAGMTLEEHCRQISRTLEDASRSLEPFGQGMQLAGQS